MAEPVKIANLPPLGEEEREDACYRGRDRAWASLVALYDHYNRTQNLTYEAVGKRIKRSRSQVQRWLSSSFNMNLNSLGLLAEGLDAELVIDIKPRACVAYETNYCHPREAARARLVAIAAEPRTLFFESEQGWNLADSLTSAREARNLGQSRKIFAKVPLEVTSNG